MAAISGQKGLAAWASANYDTNVFNWSLNISQGALDVTAFASTPPVSKAFIPDGVYEWSGSFECYLDDTDLVTVPDDPGTLVVLTLTATSGQTFVGSAFVTSQEPNASIDDSQKVTCNFQGSGVLTIA